MIDTVSTRPFDDQVPGTSGLRKKVTRFATEHYLENYVQSVFDCLPELAGKTLVVGGDGRYHNRTAIQTILAMAAANGVAKVMVGRDGILSTPALSHVIRKHGAFGGIVLSASHNPGGPDGDFGIKYNGENGGPGTQAVMDRVQARAKVIDAYKIRRGDEVELSDIGNTKLGSMAVEIIDPVADYAELMENLFDMDAIAAMFAGGFTFLFDAMHAVTGPYAHAIFVDRLGAPNASVINGRPKEDFGGGHPDPNLVHAKLIYDRAMKDDGPDLAAASDGDGDRNLIIGKRCFVTPSDSLAIIAANAHLAPGYAQGLKGVARSMPTSGAVDRVAEAAGLPMYETPTGWKFFGNLLDAGDISLCGEESAGTSSDHVREKDGLWAVLMWLNILAVRQQPVTDIMAEHYAKYGRNYYARHDYEEVDAQGAADLMASLRAKLPELAGTDTAAGTIEQADEFAYYDAIDESYTEGQGVRILFGGGSRIVYRLSGTGTVGSTLRVYIERFEPADGDLAQETSAALASLIETSRALPGIERHTGRTEPDVIT